MTTNLARLLSLPFILITGCLLLVAGCSDDDPVAPVVLPEEGYFAENPDSLMSLWRTALTTMDSTLYAEVYDPDFRSLFSAGDMSDFQLLTDYMTRDETVRTGWNMFSGQDITNWEGDVATSVARIGFPELTRETDWSYVAAGSSPVMAQARFTMQMHVEGGFGINTIAAGGSYDFTAVGNDTVLGDGTVTQNYRLSSIVPVNPGKTPGLINTWGGVHLTYLTNEAPVAALLVTDVGGSPLPVFRCDASASHDADSGLHPAAYRWQFNAGPIHSFWTDWAAEPVVNHSFNSAGDHTINLEVRDRWGAVGSAGEAVTVLRPPLPFPGSPDQLMENFLATYEYRDVAEYVSLMHPFFRTVLQQSTTDEFPDVGTTLTVDEETRIHDRMFSGVAVTDPNGDLVPGTRAIHFPVFRALDTWAMTSANDIFSYAEWAPFEVEILLDRGQNFSTLKVNGTINFYVTSRDSLHEGTDRKYYQMIGQVDLTNSFKSVESTNWGDVKAMYR